MKLAEYLYKNNQFYLLDCNPIQSKCNDAVVRSSIRIPLYAADILLLSHIESS